MCEEGIRGAAGDAPGTGGGGAGADRGGAGSLASWLEASYKAGLGATGKEPPPFVSILMKYLLNAVGAAFRCTCEVLPAGNHYRRYRPDEGDGGDGRIKASAGIY